MIIFLGKFIFSGQYFFIIPPGPNGVSSYREEVNINLSELLRLFNFYRGF